MQPHNAGKHLLTARQPPDKPATPCAWRAGRGVRTQSPLETVFTQQRESLLPLGRQALEHRLHNPCTHGGCPHPCHTPGTSSASLRNSHLLGWESLGDWPSALESLFLSPRRGSQSTNPCQGVSGLRAVPPHWEFHPRSSHSAASTSRDPAGFSC